MLDRLEMIRVFLAVADASERQIRQAYVNRSLPLCMHRWGAS